MLLCGVRGSGSEVWSLEVALVHRAQSSGRCLGMALEPPRPAEGFAYWLPEFCLIHAQPKTVIHVSCISSPGS